MAASMTHVVRQRLKLHPIALLFFVVGFFVLYNTDSIHSLQNRPKWNFPYHIFVEPPAEKLILYWTSFFDVQDFGVGFGKEPFTKCPDCNCKTTKDRSLYNQSDAIVFHIRDFNFNDVPSYRFAHQRWVFFLHESPPHTPNFLHQLANTFNWTMTYRTDSDVYMPYELDMEMIERKFLDESQDKTTGIFNAKHDELLAAKNKTIAWTVSNCDAPSGRNAYVDQLKKYIDVDVYGKCGQPCPKGRQCFEMLEKSYKFYLSFENSLCRDYVTEKFYQPLLYNMIPIVYGSANYSALYPELNSSYIDTRHFASVQELADYLHYLDKNDDAYRRYFEWRRAPAGISVIPSRRRGWCSLCRKLFQSPSTPETHADLHSWWFNQADCNKEKSLFENQFKSLKNNTVDTNVTL